MPHVATYNPHIRVIVAHIWAILAAVIMHITHVGLTVKLFSGIMSLMDEGISTTY